MDSFKFHDVRVEKANAVAKYQKFQRITSFFRFVELLLFLIALSKCSAHLFSSLKLSGEYFRQVSVVSMFTPRSVFVIGNTIVIVLFFISGQFSGNKTEKITDFYDEYVEKCRNNHQQQKKSEGEVKRISDSGIYEGKVMSRSQSANMERAAAENRRDLRRSMSEKSGGGGGRKEAAARGGYAEDKMSSEEFRRTVEAFIARQQKCLREEEEFSAVVSLQA